MESVVSVKPPWFNPRERLGTHRAGGCVDLIAGVDMCGKSHPHRDSIPKIVVKGAFLKIVTIRAFAMCVPLILL